MGKLNYSTSSINCILASVAGKAELTEVAKKADKTYVDTELAKKQDKLTAGTGIKIEGNTISATGGGGGGGGTTDYTQLDNKPSINGVTLDGSKSLDELGIQPKGSYASEQDLTSLSAKVGKIKLTPADLQDEDGVYILDLTADALKYKSVVVDFTGASADATICALICDESGAPIFEGEAAIYCKGGAFIGTDSESAKVYGSTPNWDNTKTYLCVIADNSVVYAEEEAAE